MNFEYVMLIRKIDDQFSAVDSSMMMNEKKYEKIEKRYNERIPKRCNKALESKLLRIQAYYLRNS